MFAQLKIKTYLCSEIAKYYLNIEAYGFKEEN